MTHLRLTKERIDAAEAGKTDLWLWDKDVPGFGVRIQPSGRKTYVVRYRNKRSQQRKHTIARTCDMPPAQARDLARRVFADVAAGGDPAAERQEARSGATVADLADAYLTGHAEPYKKPGSLDNDRRNFALHIIPALGSKRLADVTFADVQRLHTSMRRIKVTANRTLALLSAAFVFAQKHGMVPEGHNPCRGVKRYPERERQRILTADELGRLHSELNSGRWPDGFVRLIRLLLLTGCRKSEVAGALVSWVDFERRLLRLPDSKTGPKVVYLSDAALSLIVERRGCYAVCQGARTDKPITSIERYWSAFRKAAGIAGVRIHDLRHTVGSMAHDAGLSQREVADLLGHKRLRTTERYLHGTSNKSRAAETVARLMG